jgi:DNA replication protein DnaC
LAKLQKWVKGFDTVDPSKFRWSNARTHAPGTGACFLHSEQYESWLGNAGSLLWLHGMPGRGKSVLSTTVLQRICNQQQLGPGIAVAYFFFSFKVEASRDPDNLILSLIT